MYEIKQHYLTQLENEELRKRIIELRNELKSLKELLQKQASNGAGKERNGS
jgi:uncharacterized small protein (DUF1192 family)